MKYLFMGINIVLQRFLGKRKRQYFNTLISIIDSPQGVFQN